MVYIQWRNEFEWRPTAKFKWRPYKVQLYLLFPKQKKVATFFKFSYRLFAPPGAFILPIPPPGNVILVPLVAILVPLEAFCTQFFRVDHTLSCARYSRFFGIRYKNSQFGEMHR